MALQRPIPGTFDMVFPRGCYLVARSRRSSTSTLDQRPVRSGPDKQTGELVWQVAVMDADPTLKPSQKTVAAKILAAVQPVPPAPVPGVPFTPVELDGVTVTPYLRPPRRTLATQQDPRRRNGG